MDATGHPRPELHPVRLGQGPGGSLLYLVAMPPEELPPVRARDLDQAWHAARGSALRDEWGAARGFRFARPDGTHTDLLLADRDACCWAAAVDTAFGLRSSHGMSVCLRLLALVDLLANAPWAREFVGWARDGADLHPALLRAAAGQALTDQGRFDETPFRARLAQFVAGVALEPPAARPRLPGASP